MKPTFDAFQEMQNLIRFSHSVDAHIKNLINNEKQVIKAVNEQTELIDELRLRIKKLEEKQNETT